MLLSLKLLQQLARELKPQGRVRKRPHIKNKVEHNIFMEVKTLNKSSMRTEGPQNQLIQRPRTNLSGRTDENFSKELVILIHEFTKSVTKTSSKVQELKIYDEAINAPIYKNRWREVIDIEL